MAIMKLTRKVADALGPRAKHYIVFDQDLKGFGVAVTPRGSKSWIVEYRPSPGGRRIAKKRLTIGSVGTLTHDEARNMARDALAQVRLGSDPALDRFADRTACTVDEMIDRYLKEYVEPKLKVRTAALNRYLLKKLIAPALGSRIAKDVTRAEVERAHLAEKSRRPILANRAIAALSACYGWAGEQGIVPRGTNPAAGIKRFREQGRERYLSTEEWERLGVAIREAETVGHPWVVDEIKPTFKHLPGIENRRTKISPHVAAAFRLLILTGARLREILHLQWENVDFDHGLLRLGDSKTGPKVIVLSAWALAVLKEVPKMGRYVIAGDNLKKPRSDLKRPWEAVRLRAGLQNVRIHDLRHSFASVGAGSGLGLPIIGKLLGHAQLSTTERYAHLDSDPLRRAADKIGAKIVAALDVERVSDSRDRISAKEHRAFVGDSERLNKDAAQVRGGGIPVGTREFKI